MELLYLTYMGNPNLRWYWYSASSVIHMALHLDTCKYCYETHLAMTNAASICMFWVPFLHSFRWLWVDLVVSRLVDHILGINQQMFYPENLVSSAHKAPEAQHASLTFLASQEFQPGFQAVAHILQNMFSSGRISKLRRAAISLS